MITVTLLVTLTIWAVLKYILHMRHIENYVKHLNHMLPFIPFIGNAFYLMGKTPTEAFLSIISSIQRNDTPCKAFIGPRLIVALDKPEDIKAVLLSPKCLDKPYTYGFSTSPRSIATEQSAILWKPTRKLLNPMFNLKTLQSFIPVFNEKSRTLIKELEAKVDESAFDILEYTSNCTLDGICSTVMGLDIDLKSNQGREFIQSWANLLRTIHERIVIPWYHLDIIFRWTSLYKEQQKHLKNIQNLRDKVFDEKIKEYLSRRGETAIQDDTKHKKRAEFPFIPLFLEGKLSEDMVKQQIQIMLEVGHESTGTTIAHASLMLAMHPNIQEQVFDELHSVFDTQDEEITYEHIQKLHLLDRVIKEAMRLFPIGPFMERISNADVPIDNCILPKNTFIFICFYTLHRRKDIWGDDADRFNPDNFLPEKVESRHPFAFIPFAGGPRNCIGYQYAMFSMKVILSTLLRNYELSTDLKWSDLEFKFEIMIKLVKKHMVKITRRNWNIQQTT